MSKDQKEKNKLISKKYENNYIKKRKRRWKVQIKVNKKTKIERGKKS